MAHGHTNQYVALLLAICILVLALGGCRKKTPDLITRNTEEVFNRILYHMEPDEIVIHSLDAYQEEARIYYHVTLTFYSHVSDEWLDWDLVYFGTRTISRHFSMAWNDMGDMQSDYDAYCHAVKEGKHKSFSAQEIQRYVDAYFAALE